MTGRIELSGVLQIVHHLADRSIDECYLAEQQLARCSGRIEITAAADAFLDQLLAYADGLEVHAKKVWHTRPAAFMILAVDLVQDAVDLEGIVALDVVEAVGP